MSRKGMPINDVTFGGRGGGKSGQFMTRGKESDIKKSDITHLIKKKLFKSSCQILKILSYLQEFVCGFF